MELPATEATAMEKLNDDGKKAAAAKKRNPIAMASLTMSFTTEGTMGLIYKAKDTNWPSGKAYKVVEVLFKKYQPQDTIQARVEL